MYSKIIFLNYEHGTQPENTNNTEKMQNQTKH